MNNKESVFKRERGACLNCPAFYKCNGENISATAGGRTEKIIDGKKMICCIPGRFVKKGKPLQKYAYYCLATKRGKKISCVHDYTGNVPLWCPRLQEGVKSSDR